MQKNIYYKMLGADLSKSDGARFKHRITAQMRGISLIWMLSQCAHDIGKMWMLGVKAGSEGKEPFQRPLHITHAPFSPPPMIQVINSHNKVNTSVSTLVRVNNAQNTDEQYQINVDV